MAAKQMGLERPDGVLLVIAFYVTLAVGFVIGGLVVLVAALPAELQMARGDSLFFPGVAVLLVMAVGLVLAGGWLVLVSLRLWRSRPNSRAAEAVSAAALTIASLLAIPAFFMAYSRGEQLLTTTVVTALVFAGAGGATFWYLTRPHVRAYFG
jgi:hypothetical protein